MQLRRLAAEADPMSQRRTHQPENLKPSSLIVSDYSLHASSSSSYSFSGLAAASSSPIERLIRLFFPLSLVYALRSLAAVVILVYSACQLVSYSTP
ncbi:hypothetical protein BJX99DRAFT_240394 [Aspergillus californicus]